MWGAWENSAGHPYTILRAGSQVNEGFTDSKADLQAIKKDSTGSIQLVNDNLTNKTWKMKFKSM